VHGNGNKTFNEDDPETAFSWMNMVQMGTSHQEPMFGHKEWTAGISKHWGELVMQK
jgi:hypothetical protein